MNPTPSERLYRFIVTFKPDRPMRPTRYVREVMVDGPWPEKAVQLALKRLAEEPGHGDPRPTSFWQADTLTITVERVA